MNKDIQTVRDSLERAAYGAEVKGWIRDRDIHLHALEALDRIEQGGGNRLRQHRRTELICYV